MYRHIHVRALSMYVLYFRRLSVACAVILRVGSEMGLLLTGLQRRLEALVGIRNLKYVI